MIKEIKVELTNLCYRNCIHCSSEAIMIEKDNLFLDFDIVKRIIDEAKSMGVSSIIFTGGEATLYPGLDKLIKYAKNQNFKTKLYTMCHRTEENVNLLSSLSNNGLDEIIYSTTKELILDESVETDIQNFVEQISLKTNLKIGFHHVVTNKTISSIDSLFTIIDNLNKTRFTKISFLRYVAHGRGDASLVPSSQHLKIFKDKIISLRQKYEDIIRLGSPHNILGITSVPCTAASDTLIIGFDGRVYPCDAMKYFDYMGLGGNIYESSLIDIYNSEYFSNIRNLKECIGEDCINCNNFELCKGGCLGQKMIYSLNNLTLKTFNWYEVNAKRTMNQFESPEIMRLNAKTGIAGEMGELIDCIKKLYTHNCSDEKKETLKKLMIDEIGDIIWYIAAPLASYYGFSLEDIADEIFKTNSDNIRKIDVELIKYCAKSKDPICPFNENKGHAISRLDSLVDKFEEFSLSSEWENLDDLSYLLRKSNDKKEVIKKAAPLLLFLAKFANLFLETTLEEILSCNVERLQERYPTGFDTTIANNRLSIEEKYKTDEMFGVAYGKVRKKH